MLEYDFVISYRKGIDNTAADSLSRNVVPTPTDTFIATMSDDSGDIITTENNDAFIQDVKTYVIRLVIVTRLRRLERILS